LGQGILECIQKIDGWVSDIFILHFKHRHPDIR
jgi:hypothetical protein